MFLPRPMFMKTVLTLCLLLGFATMAMAIEGNAPMQVDSADSAMAAQSVAARKAAEIGAQAQQALEEARMARENNDSAKADAFEAVAASLSKARQGYEQAAMLYGKAAGAYASGNADAAGLDALLAQSFEECAGKVYALANAGHEKCRMGDSTSAMRMAQQADQQATQYAAIGTAGGQGHDGGSAMAGVSTITTPVMNASPSAFSGSGGRPTASGF